MLPAQRILLAYSAWAGFYYWYLIWMDGLLFRSGFPTFRQHMRAAAAQRYPQYPWAVRWEYYNAHLAAPLFIFINWPRYAWAEARRSLRIRTSFLTVRQFALVLTAGFLVQWLPTVGVPVPRSAWMPLTVAPSLIEWFLSRKIKPQTP